MANVDGRQIRFYLVREGSKLTIHEKTDMQMGEWMTANPNAKLVNHKPFNTHEEAKVALRQAK
jgi:hypothetical protein